MLTKRQREILVFIQDYQKRTGGVSPTYIEIGEAANLTAKSTVCRLIDQLEQRGFIRRLANHTRAIEILQPVPGGKEPPKASGAIPIFDADTLQLRGYLPNV